MARWRDDLPASEVTPEPLYLRRREFLALGAAGAVGALLPGRSAAAGPEGTALTLATRSDEAGGEPLTPYADVTGYNNFYELGISKTDPARNAEALRVRSWTIAIEGEVKRPQRIDIDALVRMFPLEERIYRMRCVEGWSMVIPWAGFPLSELVRRVEPTSRAKYLAFTSVHDPGRLPGQRAGGLLDWPYIEGLRIDEAVHPLTMLSVGLYGRALLPQSGAPVRLVVPWKYGFKGVKSIVAIRFVERQPPTTWSRISPGEYGFYANVNPEVSHPRWSQATERRIGEHRTRKTMPFNGYPQVASLYAGMDLSKDF